MSLCSRLSPALGLFAAGLMILLGGYVASVSVEVHDEVFAFFQQYDGPAWIADAVCGLLLGISFIVSVLGIFALFHFGRIVRLVRRYPGQPWMHNPAWVSGRIKDSNLNRLILWVGLALVWNVPAWSLSIALIYWGDASSVFLVVVITLVGLAPLSIVAYQILRWSKYGTSVFELAENPGLIGGDLGGLILIKSKVRPHLVQSGFTLTLRNIRRYTADVGGRNIRYSETIWESEQVLEQEALPNDSKRSALPVFFFIPPTCMATERVTAHDCYYWELEARAESAGLDYKATFIVPVFITTLSNPKAHPPLETSSPA